ncbi:DNA-binding protein [Planktothrix sp. FACHB-1355]|uniref:DNA-binding protein n=1 Tax=Planktothrix sp. FACHB-1355 TaxID=2692854 RepID=UPI00168A6BF8|nr:DNA-binding protein [Planktothrix sp. FACHB-1355]MBD3557391.1 DNA-binding protein [Planktothrix sp. FACHB-1355]
MSESKYDQVVAAFRELIEAGEQPSQEKIRGVVFAKTGAKMSNATIQKHLKAFRASNPDEFFKGTNSDDEPIPIEHQELMRRVYHSIRRATELVYSSEAQEKLDVESEILREKLSETEAALQTANAKLKGMEQAYQHIVEQMQLIVRNNAMLVKMGDGAEISTCLAEINRLQNQVVEVSEQKHLLSMQVTQLQKEVEDAGRLSQELSAIRAERDKLSIQLTQVAERNMELLERSQKLEAALGAKVNEIDALKAQLIAQPILPDAPVFEVGEEGALAQWKERNAQLTERNQFLEAQLKELYQKYGAAQEELSRFKQAQPSFEQPVVEEITSSDETENSSNQPSQEPPVKGAKRKKG